MLNQFSPLVDDLGTTSSLARVAVVLPVYLAADWDQYQAAGHQFHLPQRSHQTAVPVNTRVTIKRQHGFM